MFIGRVRFTESHTFTNYQTIKPFIYFQGFPSFQLPKEFVEAEIPGFCNQIGNTGIFHIEFPYSSAQQYADIMKRIITYILGYFHMNSPNETHDILQRLVEDSSLFGNPDNHEEFKHYRKDLGNKIKAILELYLHPVTLISSIANTPAQLVVRPFVKDKNALKTLDDMHNFVYSGTLIEKQAIYQTIVRDCIIEYLKVEKIINHREGISFNLNPDKNSFGIEKLGIF